MPRLCGFWIQAGVCSYSPLVNTSLTMLVKVNGRFKGLQIYCRTSHMGFSSCPWSFVLALYHSKESQNLSKPYGLLILSSFANAV